MDTKDIRSFMECFETRSINKAAKSLYITPQGLGKILDRLEQEIKMPLFERTAKGLIPTEAGVYFYEKAGSLVSDINEIELGLEAIRHANKHLRVGYSCGLLRFRKTNEMEQFESEHPDISVSWEEGVNSLIKEKLLKGQLDVAFIIGRMPSKDMVERELFSREVCAIVKRGHPFFESSSISVADLKGQQLITLNENYQLYSNLMSSCEKEGFYPQIRIKTMESSMIYRFVRDDLGIGIDADIHDDIMIDSDIRLIHIEGFIPWTGYLAYSKTKEGDACFQQFLERVY